MQAWIAEELATLDLGDVRLDQRCHAVLERLYNKPSLSIPAACQTLAEIAGAYRFFDNDRVDDYELLLPHRHATIERIRGQRVVLIPQDTTELDYTRPHEVVAGAGPLTYETQSGFHSHVQLAFTPERLCLGLVAVETWGRDPGEFGKRKTRRQRPLQDKESFRWLQGYRQACAVAAQAPETRVISLSDAESDIYECFTAAQSQLGQPYADWIIRAAQDRCVATDNTAERKLWAAVAAQPVLGTIALQVGKKAGRSARTATLTIQSATLTFQPPDRRDGSHLDAVNVNVVLACEAEPPAGEEPITWLLLTNLEVATFAQAVTVLDYYACRWQAEIFFKVLKSGCKIEKLQLETAERLLPCLLLYMIVAWRILYVTMLGRECPELSCAAVFADEEWQSVWAIVKRRPTPTTPPTLAEFLKMVAGLGGFLGRKADGAPGPQTLWIGLQRTVDFALAWQTFGPQAAPQRRTS